MSQQPSSPQNTDPDETAPACTDDRPSGPVREAGGTTGAGNLSPAQASRTGGATGGLPEPNPPIQEPRRGVKPDA